MLQVHKAALNIILNREMKLISMKCASAKMLFAPNLAPYHEQLAFKLEDERSMTQFTNFFNRCITEIDGENNLPVVLFSCFVATFP